MKKLAFSVFAAMFAFGASAAEAEPEVAVEGQECCPYTGFYFGLGLKAADGGVKGITTEAHDATKNYPDDTGTDFNEHHTNLGGTLTLGFGKAVKKGFFGIEAGLDFAQNDNFYNCVSTTEGKVFETYARQNGTIPSIALRAGYIDPNTKVLTYIKAGAAYVKAKANYEIMLTAGDFSAEGKVSKFTPIVALGIEKPFSRNMRARLEAEYRFKSHKNFNFAAPAGSGSTYAGTIKLENKDAITFRAMAVYNVKMGK